MTNIRDVRTIVLENWLRQLRRKDGKPLADTTKNKIRSLMSLLYYSSENLKVSTIDKRET
jgi:hypothetical protein